MLKTEGICGWTIAEFRGAIEYILIPGTVSMAQTDRGVVDLQRLVLVEAPGVDRLRHPTRDRRTDESQELLAPYPQAANRAVVLTPFLREL